MELLRERLQRFNTAQSSHETTVKVFGEDKNDFNGPRSTLYAPVGAQMRKVCPKWLFPNKLPHKNDFNRRQRTFSCPKCEKSYARKHDLARHSQVHLEPAERTRYPCTKCEREFTLTSNLRRHMRQQHGFSKGSRKCGCKRTLMAEAAIKKHNLCQ